MSKTTTNLSKEAVELQLFEVAVKKVMADKDIMLIDPKLSTQRMFDYMGTAVQLSAYILAEKIEEKSATYPTYVFPWWLSWTKRFIKEDMRKLTLTAWHTYPKANVAIPKLNEPVIKLTKQDYSMGDY